MNIDRALLDLHIGARDIFTDDAEREQHKPAKREHDRQQRRIARNGVAPNQRDHDADDHIDQR
ncbi:hypothetical protein SDC9_191032 [bioreactor metagenome]|uniref:Uncharacterized protein n=1 Tax=bioreactor metagenome TaxID=1076179 RepID=A0A645HY97_9ZZZZ